MTQPPLKLKPTIAALDELCRYYWRVAYIKRAQELKAVK